MRLYEKYRPDSLDGVLGQDRAVTRIGRMMDGGIGGRAFWLSGASGTGKTTLRASCPTRSPRHCS